MADFKAIARQAALKAGIDPSVFIAQINQESGFRPGAASGAGAQGIAQIVPKYHPDAPSASDPAGQLNWAANYMAGLVQKYGNWAPALSVYNSGQPDKYKDPNFASGQTYNYVKSILGAAGSPGPISSVPTAAPLPSAAPVPPTKQFNLPTSTASPDLSRTILMASLSKGPEALTNALIGAATKPVSMPGLPSLETDLSSLTPTAPAPVSAAVPTSAPAGPSDMSLPDKTGGKTNWLSVPKSINIAKVNSDLLSAVDALGKYLGKKITVESGYRDRAKQAALYQTYVDSGYNIAHIAAKPGTSNHERGQAMDLTIDGVPIANAVPADVLAKFGLHNPVSGDLPHTTLLSISG